MICYKSNQNAGCRYSQTVTNTRISPEKEKVEDIKVEGQQIKESIENNTYITLIQEKLKDTKG